MLIFRCLIIILCFIIPPLNEVEQFFADILATSTILPDWFSWLDISCRGLLVIIMAKEMVQFGRYWEGLRDSVRTAEQNEIVKMQGEAIKMQPLLAMKGISPVDGDISYLWD